MAAVVTSNHTNNRAVSERASKWVSNSTHNKLWPIKKCHPFSLYCSFCKCWPTALIFDVWYKTASNLINVALQIYSIYGGQNVRNWLTFIVGTAIKWKRVAFLWTTVGAFQWAIRPPTGDQPVTRSQWNASGWKTLIGIRPVYITLEMKLSGQPTATTMRDHSHTWPTYRHLTVMKIQKDPLCRACGEQEETSFHFLGECCANMQIRYSIFGAHLMIWRSWRKAAKQHDTVFLDMHPHRQISICVDAEIADGLHWSDVDAINQHWVVDSCSPRRQLDKVHGTRWGETAPTLWSATTCQVFKSAANYTGKKQNKCIKTCSRSLHSAITTRNQIHDM